MLPRQSRRQGADPYLRVGPLIALAVVVATPLPSLAQDPPDCVVPAGRGPLEATPAVGAFGVTLAAPVRVRYSPGYFDDPAIAPDPPALLALGRCLDPTCAALEPVAGRVQVVADTLYLSPAEPFVANARYAGVAHGIDFDLPVGFTAGTSLDLSPPVLDDIVEVTSLPVGPSCDAPEGGYRVGVSFEPARDDGPPGDIEYFLYLSRGRELEAPELRDRVRNFATDLVTMAFILQPSEATSPVCVVVHATDGVGNIDDDGKRRCFDPVQGNFFEPLCGVAGGAVGLHERLAAGDGRRPGDRAAPSNATPLLCLGYLGVAAWIGRSRRARPGRTTKSAGSGKSRGSSPANARGRTLLGVVKEPQSGDE